MKNYIVVNQVKGVALDLDLRETFILGYLHRFMQSGRMKFVDWCNERYYLITYNKVLKDLPLLKISVRTLKEIFKGLFEKNILKKYEGISNRLYVSFDGTPYNSDKFQYKFTSSKIPFPRYNKS